MGQLNGYLGQMNVVLTAEIVVPWALRDLCMTPIRQSAEKVGTYDPWRIDVRFVTIEGLVRACCSQNQLSIGM